MIKPNRLIVLVASALLLAASSDAAEVTPPSIVLIFADDLVRTIQYAADGIHFSKTHDLSEEAFAGGTYRPEAFTDSKQGEAPTWGVEIGPNGSLLCIQRFDIEWSD